MPDIDLVFVAAQFTSIGGPVVAILLVLSVVATATSIAKALEFSRLGIGRHATVAEALGLWSSGERKRAFEIVEADRAALSQVAAETMRTIGWMPGETEVARDSGLSLAADTLAALARRVRLLETIVQAAPMLGLLGTVLGMIEAFGEIAASGGAGDPGQLAGGIWVALSTTALGLAVAIPFYFVANWLEDRIERERAAMEATVNRILSRSPKRAYAGLGEASQRIYPGQGPEASRGARLG